MPTIVTLEACAIQIPFDNLLVCSGGACTHSYIATTFFGLLTHFSAMQNPQPQDVYPEMPPQLQSFHLHAHDFRRQEMGTNYPVHPRSSQSADRSINASATQNPYGLPMVMDPRFLTNPAGNLSQPYPPYISSTPSGLLTGIPHHPTVGFTQGNQFINVVNIESPTRPKQTKKRKRRNSGTTQPRKRKCKYNIL